MKSTENPVGAARRPPSPPPNPSCSVLIVDADKALAELVRKAANGILPPPAKGAKTKPSGPVAPAASGTPGPAAIPPQVRLATTVDAAEAEMSRHPADVLLVNLQIGDNAGGAGTGLIRNLKRRYPRTDIIALSRVRRMEVCLDAWRAGAADMLLAPVQSQDVQRALTNWLARRTDADRATHRHQRLRVVCRKLNKARHEISQQVDLLCNDLVRAYQEMAQQLNLTQTAAEFAEALANELDVEGVLRRTMEWILRKLGPVNAAVYLPNGEEHFALGAYLNLDTKADATLIEVLGKSIVQQARGTQPLSFETDQALEEHFGEDARTLSGRQWLAVGCHTPRECLAVLVVFRGTEASTACGAATAGALEVSGPARGLVEAVAPVLAERMEQALGLYQRLHPFGDQEDSED